jgi:hypothetical protein
MKTSTEIKTPQGVVNMQEIITEKIARISALMQFQARMPNSPFLTRDEAYKQVGCDPRAAMYVFSK